MSVCRPTGHLLTHPVTTVVGFCAFMMTSTDYGVLISSLLTTQNSDIIFRMGTNTDYPYEFLLFMVCRVQLVNLVMGA